MHLLVQALKSFYGSFWWQCVLSSSSRSKVTLSSDCTTRVTMLSAEGMLHLISQDFQLRHTSEIRNQHLFICNIECSVILHQRSEVKCANRHRD